ncbi:MAG: hypothetical protein AAF682_23130 [Planctomycetota bacterium]
MDEPTFESLVERCLAGELSERELRARLGSGPWLARWEELRDAARTLDAAADGDRAALLAEGEDDPLRPPDERTRAVLRSLAAEPEPRGANAPPRRLLLLMAAAAAALALWLVPRGDDPADDPGYVPLAPDSILADLAAESAGGRLLRLSWTTTEALSPTRRFEVQLRTPGGAALAASPRLEQPAWDVSALPQDEWPPEIEWEVRVVELLGGTVVDAARSVARRSP